MGKASTKFLGLGGGVTRRQTLDKLGNPLLSKEIKVMESGGAPCLGRRFLLATALGRLLATAHGRLLATALGRLLESVGGVPWDVLAWEMERSGSNGSNGFFGLEFTAVCGPGWAIRVPKSHKEKEQGDRRWINLAILFYPRR